jgi:hypothetical protein
MIYEFYRPGDNKSFISVNNPSPEMLTELKETFPDMRIVKTWSCPICYMPECWGGCKTNIKQGGNTHAKR